MNFHAPRFDSRDIQNVVDQSRQAIGLVLDHFVELARGLFIIRFAIDEVRKTGRAALGVKLLNLASDTDRVVGLAMIDASAQALDEEEDVDLIADAETAHPGPDEAGEPQKLELD